VKASVLLTERFKVTVANIADALAEATNNTYAERIALRLVARAESLVDMPRRGRVVPEIEDEHYRELIVGRYRIIYRTNDDASVVEVLFAFYAPRMFPHEELLDAE
jgi:toxin ParE1/3/4